MSPIARQSGSPPEPRRTDRRTRSIRPTDAIASSGRLRFDQPNRLTVHNPHVPPSCDALYRVRTQPNPPREPCLPARIWDFLFYALFLSHRLFRLVLFPKLHLHDVAFSVADDFPVPLGDPIRPRTLRWHSPRPFSLRRTFLALPVLGLYPFRPPGRNRVQSGDEPQSFVTATRHKAISISSRNPLPPMSTFMRSMFP